MLFDLDLQRVNFILNTLFYAGFMIQYLYNNYLFSKIVIKLKLHHKFYYPVKTCTNKVPLIVKELCYIIFGIFSYSIFLLHVCITIYIFYFSLTLPSNKLFFYVRYN